MSRQNEQLSDGRLIEVAEAAYRASVEIAEYIGSATRPYPADILGSPLQPEYLGQFTRFEVEQASMFLFRLGEVEAPRHAA